MMRIGAFEILLIVVSLLLIAGTVAATIGVVLFLVRRSARGNASKQSTVPAFCSRCGHELTLRFCPQCGNPARG